MGRPGSWGQGKGWSLARSEVEPAPFSWGSQIVAMRGWGRWKVGACPCICLGSPKQAAPGPGIPATRGLFPLPPSPSWSHSSWPLLHFWPWTLCRALWKTWIPVYVLKNILQLAQGELQPCISLPVDLFPQAPKCWVFNLRNCRWMRCGASKLSTKIFPKFYSSFQPESS